MNIHFSNVNFSSSSGPNSFAHRLANQLVKEGHRIVNNNQEYEIFLCFIEPASRPNPGSKFIHRLDGIWFKPEEFITKNRRIKSAYENCHHVIWQSSFDKKMTINHWGKPKNGSIIHNGIATKGERTLHPEIVNLRKKYERIFVCSASWHRQKRLKENIEFYQKNRNKNDALIVLGSNPDFIVQDENVFYLGHLTHDECLQLYSIADWFIHLAWLDHCPNVVVEALSEGCPVICTNSGGTKEIVQNNGIIIEENRKYNFELTNYDEPYSIDLCRIDLPKINVKNDHLDIKLICDNYIEVFRWD